MGTELGIVAATQSRRASGFILAPAAPGSLGDEGMMRGALAIAGTCDICILGGGSPARWRHYLGLNEAFSHSVVERSGSLAIMRPPGHGQFLLVVGADMLDGTCGAPESIKRLRFAARALANGAAVIINCSFREAVDRKIIKNWKTLRGALILLRDERSFFNFTTQVGLPCQLAPDLSLHWPLPEGGFQRPRSSTRPTIAINLSEQSFRSFRTRHSDAEREAFASEIAGQLHAVAPQAHFLLLSNDTRNWPNHPSDDWFADLLFARLSQNVPANQLTKMNGKAGYAANAGVLKSAQMLVTGRMHLALAAARVGCEPIILMGQDKGYSSFIKMSGMMRYCELDDDQVVTDIQALAGKVSRSLGASPLTATRLAQFNGKRAADVEAATLKVTAAMQAARPTASVRQKLFALSGLRFLQARRSLPRHADVELQPENFSKHWD
jgi:polysaccharide pyruvyl transferase WcaK-like protein